MVVIDMPETRADTSVLVDRLRNAGEDDFLVYAKRGWVSLGLYDNPNAAERRRREIEALGFTPRTMNLGQ